MTHQAETPETEPQPSRRAKRIVTFGIPAVVIAGAIAAGIGVATTQPSGVPAAVATSQAPVATPSTTTSAAPFPKPSATKKPVAAKPKAKPAPKSTAPVAQAPAAGSGTSESQPGTGASEGQIPQAGAPAQGSGRGSGGGGWGAGPAPAPAVPAPKPAAPKPAPPAPAPAPAPQPPVQENHYPAQTLSSINAARISLGAPGFVPFTSGCVQVASAWGSTLDGAEGYVIHPGVVGYQRSGMKIAGTFALDGQVNGRSGTLTVYSCP